ncbi:MAG: TIGR03790 family protein [Desulfatiglandales bacterium]
MMLIARSRRALVIAVVLFLFLVFWAGPSNALSPDEILVIANKNAARSVGLAKYYMEKRGIPKNNLIQLWVTDKETCTREEYERKVLPPVRDFLKEKDPLRKIRCLVSVYGLPLRISPPEMSAAEKKEVEGLRKNQQDISEELKGIPKEEEERRKGLTEKYDALRKRIVTITKEDHRSSFDSELALVLVEDYSLKGWIRNPLFIGFKNSKLEIPREKILMVSRLDGPSDEIVKRIINDSIDTEKVGLKGKAYFDARWPKPSEEEAKKAGMGYGFYDRSIHLAAERIRGSGLMPVVLNDKPELFQAGECPDAALYCGWYSLARYVDAFKWQPGSVGYHIASSECGTLKGKDSQVWCKRMLEQGVAATLGPVGEPYVQAFPVPEVFFGLLVGGRMTLSDCYMSSLPFLSWQMVLVGDPLYRPFGRWRDQGVTGRKNLP